MVLEMRPDDKSCVFDFCHSFACTMPSDRFSFRDHVGVKKKKGANLLVPFSIENLACPHPLLHHVLNQQRLVHGHPIPFLPTMPTPLS